MADVTTGVGSSDRGARETQEIGCRGWTEQRTKHLSVARKHKDDQRGSEGDLALERGNRHENFDKHPKDWKRLIG